jgi:hypothetical protein
VAILATWGNTGSHAPLHGGPFIDGNENVYLITIETSGNSLEAWKTANPTTTNFSEQDAGNAPAAGATQERVYCVQDGTRIYAYHWNSIQDEIRESWFNTSDAASNADQWHDFGGGVYTNTIYSVTTPPPENWFISAAHRSDGDRIVFFTGEDEGTMHDEDYECAYMAEEGSGWGSYTSVDNDSSPVTNVAAGDAVLAESDKIWFSFVDVDNGDLWIRSLTSANVLGSSGSQWQEIDAAINAAYATNPLGQCMAYYDDAGVERITIAYQDESNSASIEVDDGTAGSPEQIGTTTGNDGQATVGHPLAVLAKNVHVMLSDTTDDDIYRNSNDDSAGWAASDTSVDAGTFSLRRINTNIYERGNLTVLAYVIEDDSAVREYGEEVLFSRPQDSFTFTDNLTHSVTEAGGEGTITELLADLAGLTDNLDTADEFDRELQDLSGLTDQIQHGITRTRTLQDTATFADQIRTADEFERELADSSMFVDQIETEQAYIERELQDDISLTDNLLTTDVLDREVQDSFTFSDQIETAEVFEREVQDSFTFVDQQRMAGVISFEVNAGGAFDDNLDTADVIEREVQDSNVLVDQIRTGDVPEREVQDSFSFSDVLETELSFFEREISDDLDFVENLDHDVTQATGGEVVPRAHDDSFTFADQIQTFDVFEREVQDVNVLSDQIRTGDVPEREVQDSFTFTDQINFSRTLQSQVQDTSTFADQIRTSDVFEREIPDSFTFSDSLTHNVVKPASLIADSFSFSDQIEHQNCVLDREMADASTFVDNLTHSIPGEVDLSTRIKTYFINEIIP